MCFALVWLLSDTQVDCSDAHVSDGGVVVLAVGQRPLFDASAVSGLLAQLQLQQNAPPPPTSPALASLLEMGFSRQRAAVALAAHRGAQEAALHWLIEHADEPDPNAQILVGGFLMFCCRFAFIS